MGGSGRDEEAVGGGINLEVVGTGEDAFREICVNVENSDGERDTMYGIGSVILHNSLFYTRWVSIPFDHAIYGAPYARDVTPVLAELRWIHVYYPHGREGDSDIVQIDK